VALNSDDRVHAEFSLQELFGQVGAPGFADPAAVTGRRGEGRNRRPFFDALGTEVTLLQRGDTILPREDEESRSVVQRTLAGRMRVETGARWTSTEVVENGVRLHYETQAGRRSVEAEALLVTSGRVPNTDDLGLENTSVETEPVAQSHECR